jgi:hypothetical protein
LDRYSADLTHADGSESFGYHVPFPGRKDWEWVGSIASSPRRALDITFHHVILQAKSTHCSINDSRYGPCDVTNLDTRERVQPYDRASGVIVPDKPVVSVRLYCLFRHRVGLVGTFHSRYFAVY